MLLATREQVLQSRAQFAPYPSESWYEDALDEMQYTPDVEALFRSQYQLLFAYGEEQPEHPRHQALIGVPPCGWTGYTLKRFACYKRSLQDHSFPLAFEDLPSFYTCFNTALPMHVKGRIVPIASNRILSLDRHRHNGVWFRREFVRISIPYLEVNRGTNFESTQRRWYISKAWMYIAIGEYWKNYIDAGYDFPVLGSYSHWLSAFNKHYHFTEHDYTQTSADVDTVNNNTLYKEYEQSIRKQTRKKRALPPLQYERRRHERR